MSEENLYYQLSGGPFHLPFPLFKNHKDTGEMAWAECVVLSDFDTIACKELARKDVERQLGRTLKKDEDDRLFMSIFDDHHAAWILYHAVRDPSDLNKKVFISKDQILKDYTTQVLGIMYNNYTTVVLNQPEIKHLRTDSNGDVDNLMDTIIKHATETETAFFLSSATTLSVAQLVRCLVDRLKTLQGANGSSGTV